MKINKKIKKFFTLDFATKVILIEAYFYLALGRMLKALPFAKVAPTLGVALKETSYKKNVSNMKELKNVANAIQIMSRYTFWESQCLVKAFAGMKMLERRQIESTLYLGTARDEKGSMIAHAWLRSGSFYVSGSEGMEKFAVVGMFAKRVRNNGVKGDRNEQHLST
ncbi:lasso peptide biosynthesis B2 protein [Bacillus sp. 1P02SD]|uniref:lasso peptide biosynthesis B2 protein n=1 Tax=Bacillus sp. 1P02SD TaxID=3132264 RepID=UPI0039A079EC